MIECKMCTIEVSKVYPSGNCHDCETFSTPDPIKRLPNMIFEFDQHVESMILCGKCGANELNVGKGGYYTAIRCPKCKWERLIHEG